MVTSEDRIINAMERGDPIDRIPRMEIFSSLLPFVKVLLNWDNLPARIRRLNAKWKILEESVNMVKEEKRVGGQLGSPRGARFRTYERLKQYLEDVEGTLFSANSEELGQALEEIYRYPLRQVAIDTLNRQLKAGISDDQLADLVLMLRAEGRLCIIHDEEDTREPQIICSMGLFSHREAPRSSVLISAAAAST